MDRDNRTSSRYSDTLRRKRVKRIKTCIIVITLALLILPVILCIILFFRLNNLQKQIDILMIDRFGTTYTGQNIANNEFIAHAATVYNSLNSISDENDIKVADTDGSPEESDSTPSDNSNTNNNREIEYIENSSTDSDTGIDSGVGNTNDDSTQNSVVEGDKISDSTESNVNTKKSERIFEGKQVYLTFDDGPSKYTEEILNLLSDYGVKATFFVIGHTDKHSLEMYKKIIDQGHTLGMHSYSHDYNKIYKSLEDFDKDFTKLRDLLYDTTGYFPSIYRFPGGSSSVKDEDIYKYIEYLNQKSVVYFDWNVVNGDATGVDYTTKELYDNVIDGVKIHKRSIVLMHDTNAKVNTIESLEMILKTLTERGAEMLPLDENVAPIQQVKEGAMKTKK